MADEDYRWLDRDAAERLLNGEPFDGTENGTENGTEHGTEHDPGHGNGTNPGARSGTDHHARRQAARLAKALAALAPDERAGSVVPSDVSAELPGEAAALAAFREARGSHARVTSTRVGAGETVQIGRQVEPSRPARWARPMRYGLAAVLAGCMIGGVAVAASTGVFPSPFGDRDKPGPAASASSVASPEPLASPSGGSSSAPDVEPDDVTTTPEEPSNKPGSSAPPPQAEGSPGASKGGEGDTKPGAGDPQHENEAGGWYRRVVSACRDYRSGELQGEKRRRLEEAAKGSQRVTEFCGRVLGGPGGDRDHDGDGSGGGGGNYGGNGGGNGGNDGDNGDGDGDGSWGGGNDHWGNGGLAPAPPAEGHPGPQKSPDPSGSYSARPVLPDSAS
ncbi:hypothetical protein GCM10010277_81280 [Streptomyces longisporoflavus]|uniref:hypothetical protein n=1 Tax=Streptomyces longisporoflavus TaxID=28044 RepID=UPI00167DCD14|nr:hypothetical protein [Streptomyces longisporoflavus]GGV70382.1 hypothetical protein GCM10010277_81280 [Streptomyces longisporoflavus]